MAFKALTQVAKNYIFVYPDIVIIKLQSRAEGLLKLDVPAPSTRRRNFLKVIRKCTLFYIEDTPLAVLTLLPTKFLERVY